MKNCEMDGQQRRRGYVWMSYLSDMEGVVAASWWKRGKESI